MWQGNERQKEKFERKIEERRPSGLKLQLQGHCNSVVIHLARRLQERGIFEWKEALSLTWTLMGISRKGHREEYWEAEVGDEEDQRKAFSSSENGIFSHLPRSCPLTLSWLQSLQPSLAFGTVLVTQWWETDSVVTSHGESPLIWAFPNQM